MKKSRVRTTVWWLIILVVVLAGVWQIRAKLIAPETVEPLVFAVIPAEDAGLEAERFSPLVAYLTERLGRPVELMLAVDYTAVVEALKYGHADIARLGPFTYVLATQEAEVEAFAVGVTEIHGEPSYHAIIIARADRHVEDLNRASLAYVDVGSTSGYLAPSTYIMDAGIELGEMFYAGTHNAAIAAVQNGTVDAACTADIIYVTALEEGVIAEGEFDIVWTSGPLPGSPIVMQQSLDPELQDEIRAAFLEAPPDIILHIGIGECQYVPVSDSDYDEIRAIAKRHGQAGK